MRVDEPLESNASKDVYEIEEKRFSKGTQRYGLSLTPLFRVLPATCRNATLHQQAVAEQLSTPKMKSMTRCKALR